MKRKKQAISIFVLLLFIGGAYFYYNENKKKGNQSSTAIQQQMTLDNSDEDIDWDKYEKETLELQESITITKEGVYLLSGTILDGSITINTKGNVKLLLDNVSITNSSGPAIYIENANTTVIYTQEGSINTLEDASTYSNYEEEVDGVLYSKDDLVLDGLGELHITSHYQDGIVGKDDVKIINGIYNIVTVDDGIRGKDSLYIQNGNFKITAGGDTLKSTNDTDEAKGYVFIENGTFDLTAELDGIQAETNLLIQNGDFKITTGGGSSNASTEETWGNWGRGSFRGNPEEEKQSNTTDSNSAKGLKAGTDLVIENGNFELDTSDDSIHSNGSIEIGGGAFTILSGDDGMHADNTLTIQNGQIKIEKSYEGIEGAKITIENGDISVKSSDDGINVAGGNDSSSMGRPGANSYAQNTDYILTVNGGNIFVEAKGDGIDINGSGYIYGGNIVVEGPTDSANAALDYDGALVINGGTLIATGSSGMVQGLSSTSKQYNVTLAFSNNYTEGTLVEIMDESGNVLLSKTPNKAFSSLIFSSEELKLGSTYTVKVNKETVTSFTISSITTTVGNSGRGEMSGQNGKMSRR